ncbi:hypothetical protein [Sphingomonas alba]|uniref:Tyr recombinase domain-containing protein n=1 Tax=Sphingomonas alba TaxID=2908208 RepID=A0ABT0RLL7_9SPHN|nr:hypothetical protein [Sphingomonas alba]MCL6683458.1 hypothetical protein [Sphingomonas alba]
MPITGKFVRRLKSGRLEFRRAYPSDVRHYIRRREHIVTLEARCLSEAGAIERYRSALTGYERLLLQARKVTSRSFDTLDESRSAWLVESHEAACLKADDAARVAGTADPDCHDAADDGLRETLYRNNIPLIREMFESDAIALAAKQGWVFDTSTDAFSALCLDLLRATIRANSARMERDRGNPILTPIVPEPPPTKREVATRAEANSFAALVREEMTRPTFSGGPSTKQSWNTALRYFTEAHGDLAPEQITRRHVSDLADLLALSPLKRAVPQSRRGWTLRRLVEAYDGDQVDRLSHKTRATIIGALQAAWSKCQRSGRIADALGNPFTRPMLGKAPATRKNHGLTRDEAKAVFGLPIFVAGERPARGRGDASYWLPLLLLTTGARPEELAQTLVADVAHDNESGSWTLAITMLGEHPHKGPRKLKSPSAERIIPLPSVLTDLGFDRYVAWLKSRGEIALFPALRPKGERRELFASFGEWWSNYLGESGVGLKGKRPAREFRPTWATIARESGVSREAQDYLMGHAPKANDMNARYGSREPLSREMLKLSFVGWGLEKVRHWEPPL